MRTLQVRLPHASYPILIGRGLLEKLPRFLSKFGLLGKTLVVTEPRVAKHHLSRLTQGLKKGKRPYQVFFLPEGERAKEARELFRLYRFLLKNYFERRDLLIALGGGAVGDVTGFVASTYLRGVPYIQVGTTLLAQVDSSIGGKTGINLPEGKNLVGSFYQPRLVVSDVGCLSTLPRRDLVASLAEVIKYGVIQDPSLFRYLETHWDSILKRNLTSLEWVVFRSARIKARIVERDEREIKGTRMILNYGHTWAHALEATQHFRGIRHGEAVALGMVCAARLAQKKGLFRKEEEKRQNRLIERVGLPTRLNRKAFPPERVLRPMLLDKKKKGGRLRFILPEAIGRVRLVDKVSLAEVKGILVELTKKN